MHVAGAQRQSMPNRCLNVARECATSLAEAGRELPTWLDLVDGVRPPIPMDMGDPFQPRQGWQHFVSNTVEERHLRETLLTLPFVCCPTSRLTKFQPQSFRVLLLRRLHLPLPCLPAAAGVAFLLTSVASTEQLALRLGCWVAWVLLSSQLWRASARKQSRKKSEKNFGPSRIGLRRARPAHDSGKGLESGTITIV